MRTGSVAMFQIMREIVHKTGSGYAPKFPVNHEDEYFIEHVLDWAYSDSIVVVKLHRWRDELVLPDGTVKVVMTVRDMRDVVVSLMNFRNADFESSIHSNAFKGNIEGQAEWEMKIPPKDLMKVQYENFIRHRMQTTVAVAEFIGAPVNKVDAFEIERKWNINANLRRANENLSEDNPEYMSKRHIHSGKANQWVNSLTDEQVATIVEMVGEDWFKENGYRV